MQQNHDYLTESQFIRKKAEIFQCIPQGVIFVKVASFWLNRMKYSAQIHSSPTWQPDQCLEIDVEGLSSTD